MFDFSQEFPKALATVIVLSIVMWLGGKLRKWLGLDGELRKLEKVHKWVKRYARDSQEKKKREERKS